MKTSDGLIIDQLSHSWKNFKLSDIELSIRKGEYFVLLGPTGSGKTLLLEAIVGAYRPRTGRVILDGRDVTDLPPEKREISYAPQNYLLFNNMTVQENIEYGLYARGLPEEQRTSRSSKIMNLLRITGLAHRHPNTLSGGEKQRVSLGRALAVEPKLILLDEPLSSVDSETKQSIVEELRRVHEETAITMVHVTHDQWEAASLADQIGVLGAGRLLRVGKSESILGQSDIEYPGITNLFKGHVRRQTADLAEIDIGNNVTLNAITQRSGDVMLHIDPENIMISRQPISGSARNNFNGTITEITDLGPTVRLKVAAGRPFTSIVTKQSFFEMQLNISMQVFISFKTMSIRVL